MSGLQHTPGPGSEHQGLKLEECSPEDREFLEMLNTSSGVKPESRSMVDEVSSVVANKLVNSVTEKVKERGFLQKAFSYIGEKIWEGLNTKVGKIIGGGILGFLSWKIGGVLGQPLAGFLLGASLPATAAFLKTNPYHTALGVGVGLGAIAITAPIGLGILGWGIALTAAAASTFIAGKMKLWVPKTESSS